MHKVGDWVRVPRDTRVYNERTRKEAFRGTSYTVRLVAVDTAKNVVTWQGDSGILFSADGLDVTPVPGYERGQVARAKRLAAQRNTKRQRKPRVDLQGVRGGKP